MMKAKKKGKSFAICVLLAIICIVSVLIIAIRKANKNGQQIADMEAKTDEILSAETSIGTSWEFEATGEGADGGKEQKFTVPVTGTYSFEVYGAEGYTKKNGTTDGVRQFTSQPGKGSKVTGEIQLTKGTEIYLYVGQKSTSQRGGWNGGGDGLGQKDYWGVTVDGYEYRWSGYYQMSPPYDYILKWGGESATPMHVWGFSGGGGGASDIRIGGRALSNRKIVAGGGAGAGISVYLGVDYSQKREFYDGDNPDGTPRTRWLHHLHMSRWR